VGSVATWADVRVCIVDDSRHFQNLFRTLLRGMGFRRVDVFGDAVEARTFVSETPVDVAFVDVMMPRLNGIDWVRSVRRTTLLANPTMPIALVSGHIDRRVLEAAIAAGVDDVLVKPLAPSTLHRHVARLLRHPLPYVRGTDGYFGPDMQSVLPRLRRDAAFATPLRAAQPGDLGERAARRSLPGLHVELRRRTDYDAEQTFLD